MKILLLFTGAIRGEEDIRKVIITAKEQYKGHETTVCLATWKSSDKIYIFHGINYYFNYDKDKLVELTKDIVDIFIFQDNLDIENVPRCRNGCPPLFMWQIMFATQVILEKGLNFDLVVKTRNDIIVSLENPIPEKTTLLPLYWYTKDMYDMNRLNDHFIITTFEKFKKLSCDTSDIHNSGDNENLWTKCVHAIDSDIQIVAPTRYIVRKNRKYVDS